MCLWFVSTGSSFTPPHSGQELIKNAKTVYSLNINILYILWAKEFIFEVNNARKKMIKNVCFLNSL